MIIARLTIGSRKLRTRFFKNKVLNIGRYSGAFSSGFVEAPDLGDALALTFVIPGRLVPVSLKLAKADRPNLTGQLFRGV